MLVKNVKFVKGMVEIVLDEGNFFISKENYIENPITIDSEINELKKDELLEYEMVIKSKEELIKLLNKKALSEYEVYKKLNDRHLKSLHVKKIIEDLKRVGLINDEFVATINVESLLLKRKGRNEIERVLREKRIDEQVIEKVIQEIDEEVYCDNFDKIILKYCKMYENKSSLLREQLVKNKLKELGYEDNLVRNVIIVSKDNEAEKDLAKKSIFKIIRNKNIDFNRYENINKIKLKLASKGFSYDIINTVLEEVMRDEIN